MKFHSIFGFVPTMKPMKCFDIP